MNELVKRRAATAGTAVARAAVGTIPDFRSKDGVGDKVQSTIGTKTDTENPIAASRNWIARSTVAGLHKASLYRRTS